MEDEHLEQLRGLGRLQLHLDINSNHFTDAGLENLVRLAHFAIP